MNGKRNGGDKTLEQNFKRNFKIMINEYLLIKENKNPRFKFVSDFYNFYGIKKQNFIKYFNRYKFSNYLDDNMLLPQKRGPKYINKMSNSNIKLLENRIIELRISGLNKYEIRMKLIEEYKDVIDKIPSCSKIYYILKKYKLNKLKYINLMLLNLNNDIVDTKNNDIVTDDNSINDINLIYDNSINNINLIDNNSNVNNINNNYYDNNKNVINNNKTIINNIKNLILQQNNKTEQIQKIIKENPGDMFHIDCHYLPKNIIQNDNKRYYIIGIMDDCSRIVSLKLASDIKATTIMFKTLEMLNFLKHVYGIVDIKEILSDNGSEFGSGKSTKNKDSHPFELLLKELGIKHRYTKPYKPQTNGKIERFWKILDYDLIEDMIFDSKKHLEEELLKYTIYYNELRIHGSLNNKTPKQFLEEKLKCKNINN